ncbi:cytochrome c [Luteimonas sp. RIT-PG2_3]
MALAVATVAAMFAALAASADVGNEDVLAHRERMNAAQDLKYEVLDGFDATDLSRVGDAATRMLPLLDLETGYWQRSGLADIQALAVENRAYAERVAQVAASGDADATREAWADLERSCSGCHDLQPQLRLGTPGSAH